jgi:hypothetical protein
MSRSPLFFLDPSGPCPASGRCSRTPHTRSVLLAILEASAATPRRLEDNQDTAWGQGRSKGKTEPGCLLGSPVSLGVQGVSRDLGCGGPSGQVEGRWPVPRTSSELGTEEGAGTPRGEDPRRSRGQDGGTPPSPAHCQVPLAPRLV